LKLEFSPSLSNSVTYVGFGVFAKTDGNGWLKFEIGSVNVIEIGAGAFTLGYDVTDSELTLLGHHWVDRIYKLVSVPLHSKPESNPERQTTTLQNLNAQSSDSSRQLIQTASADAFKKVYGDRFFNDEVSGTIGSLRMQVAQHDVQTQVLEKFGLFPMLQLLVNRLAPALLLPVLNNRVNSAEGAGEDLILPIQTIRLQDIVDGPKINSAVKLAKQFAVYLQATDARAHAQDVRKYCRGLTTRWASLQAQLSDASNTKNQAIARGLLADAHAIASSTLLNGWSSVAVQDLNVEVQAWEKVVQGISENQISAKFDFHARALPLLVSNDKRINLRLATYYGAEVVGGFESPAIANANVNTRAKFGAQYPYTIGLSLDSINRLLKKEFLSGRATFLNICISKEAQVPLARTRHCSPRQMSFCLSLNPS